MAEQANNGSEELAQQGNTEVAIDDIVDGKGEASSPQNSALVVGNSGTRRRHNHNTSSSAPAEEAEANNGSEELAQQGNTEVAIDDIVDGKEEASSPQNSALVGNSGTRRRHNHNTSSPAPTPAQQVSIAKIHGNNNNIRVSIDTNDGRVEEAAPPPIAPAGRSQGEPRPQTDGGADGGLAARALMTVIGKYLERVGPIIALIGLGTITSTIGGIFTRGSPSLFVYFFTDQHWDADGFVRDALVQHDAIILYYKCLPAFFLVGLLELCYGIWVSRNQEVRAGKCAKTILIFSAILLIVTVCFTGAGVNV